MANKGLRKWRKSAAQIRGVSLQRFKCRIILKLLGIVVVSDGEAMIGEHCVVPYRIH